MKDARYWRLKAGLLEAALYQEQAARLSDRAAAAQARALEIAGLDPTREYELDDRGRRVTQRPKPPGPERLLDRRDLQPKP